jgi:hypothetical protein
MSNSDVDNNDEMGETASTPATSSTSSSSETKDENNYRPGHGSSSVSLIIRFRKQRMKTLMSFFTLRELKSSCNT